MAELSLLELTTTPKEFYQNGMEQLNGVAAGEENAKTAVLLALLMRQNYVLGGPAGDGKSTLADHAPGLLYEANPSTVVRLKGQNDVTGTQLVGGEITTEDTIVEADGTKTEKTSSRAIKGIFDADTVRLAVDEINLLDPDAAQTLNQALENRELVTTAGVVPLNNLTVMSATMNQTDQSNNGYDITARQASRFPIGALVGDNRILKRDERIAQVAAKRQFMANHPDGPSPVEPVASLESLKGLRAKARATALSDANKIPGLFDSMTVDMVDALHAERISEGTGRMVKQVMGLSRGLGAMKNKEGEVSEEEVKLAVYFVMAARLGMQTTKSSAEIREITKSVTE